MSWACPPPFLCGRSVALSPLLPHVFADGFHHWCAFRFCGGASPLAFGPVGPLGSCGGSTYIALHRAWLVSAILPWAVGAQVGVFIFFLRDVPHVFMVIILSVSLTYECPCLHIPIGLCSWATWGAEWLGWLSVPLLALSGLYHLLWLIVSTVCPDASCDRHSVAVSLSPSLTVALTPCYSGTLGGLSVLVGSLTYPSPGRMFEPFCFGRLWCHEAGLTYRPLLALPGLC